MSSDAGSEPGTTSTAFTRGGRAEETNRLPVDAVFEILADERRRHLLYYLIDVAGGEATPTEVADHLAAVESSGDPAEQDAILVDLHHRHLPKMVAADVLDCGESGDRGGLIRYLGDPLLEECLARVASRDVGRRP